MSNFLFFKGLRVVKTSAWRSGSGWGTNIPAVYGKVNVLWFFPADDPKLRVVVVVPAGVRAGRNKSRTKWFIESDDGWLINDLKELIEALGAEDVEVVEDEKQINHLINHPS